MWGGRPSSSQGLHVQSQLLSNIIFFSFPLLYVSGSFLIAWDSLSHSISTVSLTVSRNQNRQTITNNKKNVVKRNLLLLTQKYNIEIGLEEDNSYKDFRVQGKCEESVWAIHSTFSPSLQLFFVLKSHICGSEIHCFLGILKFPGSSPQYSVNY